MMIKEYQDGLEAAENQPSSMRSIKGLLLLYAMAIGASLLLTTILLPLLQMALMVPAVIGSIMAIAQMWYIIAPLAMILLALALYLRQPGPLKKICLSGGALLTLALCVAAFYRWTIIVAA